MLAQRLRSFRYAFRGIAILVLSQPNARIHLLATLAVTALGIWFQISGMEWTVLILTISLVLGLEALNTALEFLVDVISPGYHELAGKAKDVAAGAVLIAAAGSVAVGLIIFAPRLWAWVTAG